VEKVRFEIDGQIVLRRLEQNRMEYQIVYRFGQPLEAFEVDRDGVAASV
jgi:hypothetical protein